MTDNNSQSRPGSIEQQLESLPPLPDTVAKVLQVAEDPESSANDLMKAILPDQPMCMAILKLANSALYGRPKAVSSIETAITVLGFNEIQNIVLGKAAISAFRPIIQQYRKELQGFWEHAFTCALAAKNIAEQLNQKPGPFFMAGLLHDLGKLVLLLRYEEHYQSQQGLQRFSTTATLAQEQHDFTARHDILGGHLLKRWHFPASLVIALQFHHQPEKAPTMQELALIVQLADFLAHMYTRPRQQTEKSLLATLEEHLPHFVTFWQTKRLPWQDITVETWLAFLKIDRDNGSAVLDILVT